MNSKMIILAIALFMAIAMSQSQQQLYGAAKMQDVLLDSLKQLQYNQTQAWYPQQISQVGNIRKHKNKPQQMPPQSPQTHSSETMDFAISANLKSTLLKWYPIIVALGIAGACLICIIKKACKKSKRKHSHRKHEECVDAQYVDSLTPFEGNYVSVIPQQGKHHFQPQVAVQKLPQQHAQRLMTHPQVFVNGGIAGYQPPVVHVHVQQPHQNLELSQQQLQKQ